jgi:uncharacterized protein (TIGR02186 family)
MPRQAAQSNIMIPGTGTRLVKLCLRLAGLALLMQLAGFARAQGGIVLEPETDHVDITTAYAGADVRIFGAMDAAADLIIKITGPAQDVKLSREVQHGPFWIGGGTASVTGAPSLVYLYATKPIASLLPPAERLKYGLDLESAALRVEPQAGGISEDRWRRAFFRLKEREHMYLEDDRAIRVTRNRLVMSSINLPAEIEFGTYRIEALLVRGGKVVGRDTGQFVVRQVGIGRWVWRAAHRHAWLFGVACTLAAMVLGFALNAATHRQR